MKEREKQIWDFQTFPSFSDRYRHSVCDRYGQFSLAIGRTSVQFQQIAQTCTFLAKASIIVIIVCDIPMSRSHCHNCLGYPNVTNCKLCYQSCSPVIDLNSKVNSYQHYRYRYHCENIVTKTELTNC